ncbi:MAG TPA: non-canonical purine NTP pyrophosphatase [Acidobacteriaceae bacterium]|nr:non-canonical purine NTP pyrophosphatase [Acidobacteriaceae bacterium]
MVLYAATTNPGKLAEFAESASDDGIDVRALPNIAALPEPVEDAATFMGNAEIKAVAYSLASPGLMVFADDSGLEIDALGGAPGVRSARFADDRGFDVPSGAGKDERNNLCVLSLLAGVPAAPRGARFVCALVLARDGKVELRAEGKVEGEILDAPRGQDGFGYDPLFLLPDLGLTMAELAHERKWKLSHRGNAFRDLLGQLRNGDFLATTPKTARRLR